MCWLSAWWWCRRGEEFLFPSVPHAEWDCLWQCGRPVAGVQTEYLTELLTIVQHGVYLRWPVSACNKDKLDHFATTTTTTMTAAAAAAAATTTMFD